jgi:NAD(P)-dependent dehydrogenase (short-subunit alcohol dehydrogenase family)
MSVLDVFRLDGRTAFISGAAGHLGREMALALGEAGAHLNGRNDARLQAFASNLATRGIRAECAAFDMMDFPAVQRFFAGRPFGRSRQDPWPHSPLPRIVVFQLRHRNGAGSGRRLDGLVV